MALRSLLGKDAFPSLSNFEGSIEAYAEALKKSVVDETRRDSLEWEKRIWKNCRDGAFLAVGGLGLGTYVWSHALASLADALHGQEERKAVDAEQGKAVDAED